MAEQGRAGQDRAVQCRKPSCVQVARDRGTGQGAMEPGKRGPERIRDQTEVRGQRPGRMQRHRHRHAEAEIETGGRVYIRQFRWRSVLENPESRWQALRCTNVFHRVGGVDHRSSSTLLHERDRQTDRQTYIDREKESERK